jgi:hypothetical protein
MRGPPRARAGTKPTNQLAAKKRKRRKNKAQHDNAPREGAEPLVVITNRQTPGSIRRLPPLLSCALCASSRLTVMRGPPRARAGTKPTNELAAKKRNIRKKKVKQDNPPREGAEPLVVITNRQTPGSIRRLPPLLSCALCASSRLTVMRGPPRARAGTKPTNELAAKKRNIRKKKVKQDNPPREGAEPLVVITNRQTPGSIRRLPPLLSCALCASSRLTLTQSGRENRLPRGGGSGENGSMAESGRFKR